MIVSAVADPTPVFFVLRVSGLIRIGDLGNFGQKRDCFCEGLAGGYGEIDRAICDVLHFNSAEFLKLVFCLFIITIRNNRLAFKN